MQCSPAPKPSRALGYLAYEGSAILGAAVAGVAILLIYRILVSVGEDSIGLGLLIAIALAFAVPAGALVGVRLLFLRRRFTGRR